MRGSGALQEALLTAAKLEDFIATDHGARTGR